jgi:triphosphatase
LKLAASIHDAAEIAAVDRGLVALSQVFGPARDWDVFTAGTLAAIAPHLADEERRGFHRLRLRASRRRRLHRAARQAEVGSQRFTCLLLALGRLRIDLELAAPDPPATALAGDALARSERRLRKRGKRLDQADEVARHRVRVAAKKLRYAAEFFSPLFRHAGANAYVDALAKLQGTLGHLNDMAAAARLIDEILAPARNDVELSRAAGIVRGWTAALSARELERLPKSWRQFAKAKPFWN